MSKSSKLYADRGQAKATQNGPHTPAKPSESPKPGRDTDRLRRTVLEALGEPDDLVKIDARPLHWPEYYRINVYREIKGSAKMTDSFYVIATNNGATIASSNPPMKKKYWDRDLEAISSKKECLAS